MVKLKNHLLLMKLDQRHREIEGVYANLCKVVFQDIVFKEGSEHLKGKFRIGGYLMYVYSRQGRKGLGDIETPIRGESLQYGFAGSNLQ
jgi:hypothetical protein